jgi:hypothetical protein
MSSGNYSKEFDGDIFDLINDEDEKEYLITFINEGTPIILCDELESLDGVVLDKIIKV